MNLDHFLDYWTQHNVTIIESLCVLIMGMCLVLAYNALFSKSSHSDDGHANQVNLDALGKNLELAIQKMMNSQGQGSGEMNSRGNSAQVSVGSAGTVGGIDPNNPDSKGPASQNDSVGGASAAASDLVPYKKEIEAKEKKIGELNALLKQAQDLAEQERARAKAAGSGGDPAMKANFEKQIQNLEQKVAEYEIIAEDIADLSKYKEENSVLKKEVEKLKNSSVAGASSGTAATENSTASGPGPAAVSAPVTASAPTSAATPSTSSAPPAAEAAAMDPQAMADAAMAMAMTGTEPSGETSAASSKSSAAAMPTPALAAEPIPAVDPAPPQSISSIIDDDLMKEFAAAVASQKAGTLEATKAPPASVAGEGAELIEEFEQFVKKAN